MTANKLGQCAGVPKDFEYIIGHLLLMTQADLLYFKTTWPSESTSQAARNNANMVRQLFLVLSNSFIYGA